MAPRRQVIASLDTDKHRGHQLVTEFALIALTIALFYFSFPNKISLSGFGFLGFCSLFPLLRLIQRVPLWRLCIYAPIIGYGKYFFFNIWLINFHPLAIFVVPIIYAFFYLILIPLMKLPVSILGKWSWLAQVAIWLGFEFLRTQGFLSYPYGIIGYTQYLNIPFVNFASITGIWGVSALVLLPQFFLAQFLPHLHRPFQKPSIPQLKELFHSVQVFLRKHRFIAISFVTLYSFVFLYGIISQVDYSDAETVGMILVQQNVDPWIGGDRAYRASMEASIRQTKEALAQAPLADLVVWSETSFIPSIDYHTKYRRNPERYQLVDELLSFIDSIQKPVLFGNGDGVLLPNENGNLERRDYNAVYLYENRQDRQIYRKLHLVPFSEYFPYQRQVPWLYNLLVENNTSFWERGEEWTVFELEGIPNIDTLRFSTPICFEDSFTYLARGFVQAGADLIINLTNDSWSKSVPAATQHAAMAVFRSTENRRTVVRSTNGGLTVVIDPNGRIIARNEPFTESYIVVDVPVYTGATTFFSVIGDLFAHIFLVLAILSLVLAIVLRIRHKTIRPT